MNRFDWDDLRFFLAVARAGRLTVAARRLGADHATVSRRITALEDALKAKLFERRPQGYALTEHGERLLAKAETIESEALAAQSEIGGADLALSGTVRIGAPDGFGTFFLAPRIGRLAERYPELEIQLVAMPRLLSLSKREADIAISLNPPKEGKIVARKLADYRLGLYAAPAYLAAHPAIIAPQDLFEHQLIGYIDDLIFTPELDYLDDIAKGLRPRLQSSNLIAQMHATIAGAGLCVLPDFMAAGDPRLVPVLRREVELVRSFWLIVHADLRDVARVRATVDFLVREAKAARAVLMPQDEVEAGAA
ncbi:LysR family transcriptional regulator [Chelatococcus daeguensis]|uniref:LysR family transcriptional regulator n=2 Tax=Chelatococcus TaxID=28209 RepID=A0AAC9NXJ5_9HYPH|nr:MULTISPECIES: LysR family transcriptional regulator [Chelatococcus]APF36113.1 LysR family transcriptional regulator [Chelatococcus daeguensis]KZE34752.1 LysR family transcriptional regulator [Chelatococcus daeguensis]MBM3082602.1 LysR family transcriptional regulator [Chelatococcus daeguensis]CUA88800.1 DNA-binding transcriptional regulator, LysR family [Chelatococcus sambhunathii]